MRLFKSTQNGLCMAIFILFSLASPTLFAADHHNTKIEQHEDEPAVQRALFERDVRLMQVGDTLSFDVTPTLTLTVSQNTKQKDGSHSIKAVSASGARLLMTADDKALYGSIVGGGLNYSISTDSLTSSGGNSNSILVNQNHADFPEIDLSHDAMVPPTIRKDLPGIMQMSKAQKSKLDNIRAKTNGNSHISILFVYSSEFGAGFASPLARINDLLSYTNQSMSDSDINITFTLAGAQQLNFNNSLSTSTTLQQATNGTGSFSGVAALRDQLGADMVAVLSFQNNFSANGIAWVNGNNPNFAFSSTRLSPQCCNSVFAHELGHNLGSGHERASVNNPGSPCSSFNFTGYSCGHGNASNNWGTMMSRLNSEIVGDVFSNPLSSDCLGEPCGIPEGQTGAADNTRSFNISRLLVADFRPDPNPIALSPVINLLLDD